jgi:hypothetical protein
MKKRRIIPTFPIEALEGTSNEKYKPILYNSILEGMEYALDNNKTKFIAGRFEIGDKQLTDIEILKDSFEFNLDTCLEYFEKNEEYEKCSKVIKLKNQL